MDIDNVAKLARLTLSEEESKAFTEQFDSILNYFEQIKNVDTANVEPMITPTDIALYLRKDEAKEWEGSTQVLEEAPETSGQLFKVPPVV